MGFYDHSGHLHARKLEDLLAVQPKKMEDAGCEGLKMQSKVKVWKFSWS